MRASQLWLFLLWLCCGAPVAFADNHDREIIIREGTTGGGDRDWDSGEEEPRPERLLATIALDDWPGFLKEWERSRPFSAEPIRPPGPRSDPAVMRPWQDSNPAQRQKLLIVAGEGVRVTSDMLIRSLGLQADPDSIEYQAVGAYSEGRAMELSLAPTNALWAHAWQRLSEASGVPAAQLRERNALLLLATYTPVELAGLKHFRLRGHWASWYLERGALRAQLRFSAASAPDEFDPMPWAVIGQAMHVELRFRDRPPFDSVEAALGRNGALLPYAGANVITLSRTASDGRIFRSAALLLQHAALPQGEAPALQVLPGDQLQAQATDPSMGVVVPQVARILVKHQPDLEWMWALAVARAGKAINRYHGDPRTASREVIAEVSNLTFLHGTWTTQVRLGDLAAMILLRERFLQLMRDYLAEARKIQSPRELLGFSRMVAPGVLAGTDPLGAVEVLDPATLSHGKLRYAAVIDPGYLKKHFDRRIAAETFVQGKTREALDAYLAAVEYSIARASAIQDHHVAELLDLTSSSFKAIVDDLVPKLLVPVRDEATGLVRWEPDRIARAHIKGIAGLGAQLRAQRQLAAADKAVVLAAASVPLIVTSGFLVATVASLAMNAEDVADALSSIARSEADAAFATGNSAVLGMDSVNMAELQRTPLWLNLLVLTGAGIGLKTDVLEAVGRASLAAARSRAGPLLARLDKGGWDEFARMSDAEKVDVLAVLGDATLAAKDPKALQQAKSLLASGERAMTEAASPSSEWSRAYRSWKKSLNPETQKLLEDNAALARLYDEMRPEIRRLLTRCSSPCIPAKVTAADILRLEGAVNRLGLDARTQSLVGDFLHANPAEVRAAIRQVAKADSALAVRIRIIHLAEEFDFHRANMVFDGIAKNFPKDLAFRALDRIPRQPKPEGLDTMMRSLASDSLAHAQDNLFVLERVADLVQAQGGKAAVSFERQLAPLRLGNIALPARRYDAVVGNLHVEMKNYGSAAELFREYGWVRGPSFKGGQLFRDVIRYKNGNDIVNNLRWIFPQHLAADKATVRKFMLEQFDTFAKLTQEADIAAVLRRDWGVEVQDIERLRRLFDENFDTIVNFSGRRVR